jgi:hypothetical protein
MVIHLLRDAVLAPPGARVSATKALQRTAQAQDLGNGKNGGRSLGRAKIG